MAPIEFFFDIGSPYSYLASTQLDALEARAGVPVRWRPFLVGGVFKSVGNRGAAAAPAVKMRWVATDLQDWATFYDVPFQMASRFPLNTILSQRALAAVADSQDETRALAHALFKAYWVEDRDISAPEVVAAIADGAGLDGAALLAKTQDQAIKDRLRADTDEAVERGAFGAPTFFVGERLFWGNDRINLVEWAATRA